MIHELLLSQAYSWFIGLLVIMIVMALLFVFISVALMLPVGEDQEEEYNNAQLLIKKREAELTQQILEKQSEGESAEELVGELREVAASEELVERLVEEQKAANGEIIEKHDDANAPDGSAEPEKTEENK